jgi:hypothetical protein
MDPEVADDPEEAMEYLALASLMRRLDDAASRITPDFYLGRRAVTRRTGCSVSRARNAWAAISKGALVLGAGCIGSC